MIVVVVFCHEMTLFVVVVNDVKVIAIVIAIVFNPTNQSTHFEVNVITKYLCIRTLS